MVSWVSRMPSSVEVDLLRVSPRGVVCRVSVRHCESMAAVLHSVWVWSWLRIHAAVSFLKARVTFSVRSTPTVEVLSTRTLPKVSKLVTVDVGLRGMGAALLASSGWRYLWTVGAEPLG